MGHLHMPVDVTIPYKCCLAVAMLASQLRCPVIMTEVVLKAFLPSKLLATALVLTTEGLFFEMHNPNVSEQMTRACKLSSALGIFATQLLLSMSCSALVSLQVVLVSKNLIVLCKNEVQVFSTLQKSHLFFLCCCIIVDRYSSDPVSID